VSHATWNHICITGITLEATVLLLGAHNAPAFYLDGNICQVGIWSKTLTQAQVQRVMERTYEEFNADDKTSLVSYWALDEMIEGSELITNGNFESNISNWTTANETTFERNTSSPISGTGDLHYVGDGSGYGGVFSNGFSVTAGKSYHLSFDYKLTVEVMYLKISTTAGATYANVSGTPEPTISINASATHFSITFTPTESVTAYLIIRSDSSSAGNLYLDNVSVKEVSVEDKQGSNDGSLN
jgi:hypothetical protein